MSYLESRFKSAFQQQTTPSPRFELKLEKTSDSFYNSFSFNPLVKDKYGAEAAEIYDYSQNIFDRCHDYEEESYIDNTDVLPDSYPAGITTECQGYFINEGKLKLKSVTPTSDENKTERLNKQRGINKKHKERRLKRQMGEARKKKIKEKAKQKRVKEKAAGVSESQKLKLVGKDKGCKKKVSKTTSDARLDTILMVFLKQAQNTGGKIIRVQNSENSGTKKASGISLNSVQKTFEKTPSGAAIKRAPETTPNTVPRTQSYFKRILPGTTMMQMSLNPFHPTTNCFENAPADSTLKQSSLNPVCNAAHSSLENSLSETSLKPTAVISPNLLHKASRSSPKQTPSRTTTIKQPSVISLNPIRKTSHGSLEHALSETAINQTPVISSNPIGKVSYSSLEPPSGRIRQASLSYLNPVRNTYVSSLKHALSEKGIKLTSVISSNPVGKTLYSSVEQPTLKQPSVTLLPVNETSHSSSKHALSETTMEPTYVISSNPVRKTSRTYLENIPSGTTIKQISVPSLHLVQNNSFNHPPSAIIIKQTSITSLNPVLDISHSYLECAPTETTTKQTSVTSSNPVHNDYLSSIKRHPPGTTNPVKILPTIPPVRKSC